MFKIVTIGSDGAREEDDELFETEAEAEAYGEQYVSDYSQGAEVLHMHNPGEYPESQYSLEFEVIEVDD